MIDIGTIRLSGGSTCSVLVEDGAMRLHFVDRVGDGAVWKFPIPIAAEFRDMLSRAIIMAGRSATEIHGDLLVGALRHTLGLAEELKKSAPAEHMRICTALIADVRSRCPQAFENLKETP